MSSRTTTKTTIACDSLKVGGRWCPAQWTVEGKSTEARAAAKRAGWVHKHWCGTKIDLCCKHSTLPLPECDSKGGRPKKCSACGERGGPYPNGDRPKSNASIISGCPKCGFCY